MKRLLVLGPGASGKSTFAKAVGDATAIPRTALDKVFWSADLEPTPREEWIEIQELLTRPDTWILDGDLGKYDALEVRLPYADTVVVLDLPTWLCAWRAMWRSRERRDFWWWLLTWRWKYRPQLMRAIGRHAAAAELLVIRNRRDVERTKAELIRRSEAV
ncbi:MAG TPA: hypothetical protein VF711_02720 [Acidimicrobiales bacterium]